jgi:transposase
MEKIDARKQNPEVQYEIRKQVIRLREKGFSNKSVAQGVGISVYHASRIWQSYRKGGSSAIKPGIRGRRYKEKRALTDGQEREIQRLLIDKTPDQLKFPFALWTRKAVQEIIGRQYGIAMPIRTVGEYLSRWGFTPQKPIKRAREQKPEAVEKWLTQIYPQIAAKAKREKAEVYWGDETGMQNEANRSLGYSLKGIKPVLRIPSKKERISMISAINNEGKVRFTFYRESMNSSRLIDFMKRLVKDAKRKVYLILDNLRAHHSKDVTIWLAKNKDAIEVFYLPPYAPELNPDEYLNCDLNNKIHSGIQAHTSQDLKRKAESFMRTLVKRRRHVKKYFHHPAVSYAA